MSKKIDSSLPFDLQSAEAPEVINHTPWPAQYFQHIDAYGAAFHIMVSRVSFDLSAITPESISAPPLAVNQTELATSDTYVGEINASSLLAESDFAPIKPRCDVLVVNATAYAPSGKASKRWPVGLRVGDMEKKFQVNGVRRFAKSIASFGAWDMSNAEAATQVPILYERAYGGPNVIAAQAQLEVAGDDVNRTEAERALAGKQAEALPEFYAHNPIGTGRMSATADRDYIASEHQRAQQKKPNNNTPARWQSIDRDGYAAPQLEAFDRPFTGQPDYPVIGLGPIAKWWSPRIALAGTYDEAWKVTQWPKPPEDHDYRYWNCAPEDQQIAFPKGGEEVVIVGLTPDGQPLRFRLPEQHLQVLLRFKVGVIKLMPMKIDTIIIDMKALTLTLVRRAFVTGSLAMRKMELAIYPPGYRIQLGVERSERDPVVGVVDPLGELAAQASAPLPASTNAAIPPGKRTGGKQNGH